MGKNRSAIQERGKIMVLFTGETISEGTRIELLCEHCRESVGMISRSEASEYSAYGVEVICDNCDEVHAGQIPAMLNPGLDETVYIIGPRQVTAIRGERSSPDQIDRMQKVISEQKGLSSSPYLHVVDITKAFRGGK